MNIIGVSWRNERGGRTGRHRIGSEPYVRSRSRSTGPAGSHSLYRRF